MSTAATPDPDLVAAALNRYLAARSRARHGVPGGTDDLAAARDGLVHLLRQAGWEPPAVVAAALRQAVHRDRAPRRRSA